tara:strand:- start:506 stop:3121 length:2616 start_codon:yes stop_codon:yes gene_type:complete
MRKISLLFIFILPLFLSAQKSETLLDFWEEEPRLFFTAKNDFSPVVTIQKKRAIDYKSKYFSIDHSTKKEGDLCVSYTAHPTFEKFGFISDLWTNKGWDLSEMEQLRFWLKVKDPQAKKNWKLTLVDANGNTAKAMLTNINTNNSWQELQIPLNSLKVEGKFDWKAVDKCVFGVKLTTGAKIWMDGIRFTGNSKLIGVTDKPLSQRIQEAKLTKATRIQSGFQEASKRGKPSKGHSLEYITAAFAKMMLNEDLKKANEMLVEELKKSSDENAWSLLHTPLYCRFYYLFSNKNGKYPGRMTAKAEKLLLSTLWDRTAAKNDIYWATENTWILDGSENHDLNAKACNLITSRIFMNEPDYKDRIFPDYGFGGSYHYGHAGYYGAGVDPDTRHGGGRANLSNGKKYNAEAHYQAWLKYMKTYFKERAERGFFLEYGAYGYSQHSLNMVDLAYQFSGDSELHNTLHDFLTVYWTDWAQLSISGVRGGPKTRHHSKVYGGTGTANLISFHLGGAANAKVWWYWNLINDFELHPVVWKMALDRKGMGNFTYKARGIGEENNLLPRPLGAERSLVVDTDARFLKNTYVTPDYTIGTQMDHPAAVQSHLSCVGRWHGMTFSNATNARIVPVGLTNGLNVKKKKSEYDLEVKYQTVQHEKTLIIQQNKRWYAIHPEWWPTTAEYNEPVGIWCGTNWDRRVEKEGWVFVQNGNAYAAFRPVVWDEEYEKSIKKYTEGNQKFFNAPNDPPTVKIKNNSYTWNQDKSIMKLNDIHAPVIIEAASTDDYLVLESFIEDILDNPLVLYKTVVPGDYILVYTGCGDNAKEIVVNNGTPDIPSIDGKSIDYSYPMTFDSPYIKSTYKSGIIDIQYGGEEVHLDFSKK